jgi:hypothetical protein
MAGERIRGAGDGVEGNFKACSLSFGVLVLMGVRLYRLRCRFSPWIGTECLAKLCSCTIRN